MEAGLTRIDSLEELEKGPGGEYNRWCAEIEAAEKELDKWQKRARKIVKEYRAERIDVSGVDPSMERRFNLYAANVNILSTALLNQTPKPTVNREFKDPQDDVGRVACRILERALESHNGRNFATFNLLKQIVQDMLVPGSGTSWHTYDAEVETKTEQPSEEMLAANPQAEALEYDEVVSEQIKDEYVYWEDLLWSPARTWEEVRWIDRKLYMTRDQLVKRFGPELGKKIPLEYNPKKSDHSVKSKHVIFQQAIVHEIWDKSTETVIWLTRGMEEILEQKPDFLELDDFWPCPKFLTSTVSNGQYIPIPDYHYASDQYRELNEINTRISLLVRACRVAGVYDKAAPAVQALLNNAAENTLVPVDQWAAFAEKGGIKGVVDWVPLDQIVITIEQLLKNREDVKNQIYEITGMADIIRGTSKASETLGAQKIKAQYASMRIQDRQKNVVEYASSMFDIQAQIMRKHMDIAEILKLAQADFMGEEPQLVQQAVQLIKNPQFILRARVESDSLSDIDFQAEKQDRMEYMTTVTNYLKETVPMIQTDPIMAPFLMQLLQFSLAGFKVGKKFEGELDRTFAQIQQQLKSQDRPQKSPEEKKVEMEMAQSQEEHELDKQGKVMDINFKREELGLKLQGKRQEAAVDQQIAQQEMAQSNQQFNQQMQQDRQRAQQDAVNTMIQGEAQAESARMQPKPQGAGRGKA